MRALTYAMTFAAVLAATAAAAQQSPQTGQQMHGPMMGQGMMTPGMMGHGMMGSGMMPMMGMMDPTQHIEGRLAFLRAELKITDAQAAQWNAFADAVRANAKRMGDLMSTMRSGGMMAPGMMMRPGMMAGQGGAGLSLPERLERAEQHMTTHLELLRAMKGPTMQLYAALSDEQKRSADLLIHGPMGMGGMM